MSATDPIYPVIWQNDSVILIDQTRLPGDRTTVEIQNCEAMARAIKTMTCERNTSAKHWMKFTV